MKQPNKVKVTKSTWLGRAGTSTAFLYGSKPDGRRVVVHVWADAPGMAEITVMRGTFWRGAAPKVFENTALEAVTQESLLAEVSRLATKHFGGGQ